MILFHEQMRKLAKRFYTGKTNYMSLEDRLKIIDEVADLLVEKHRGELYRLELESLLSFTPFFQSFLKKMILVKALSKLVKKEKHYTKIEPRLLWELDKLYTDLFITLWRKNNGLRRVKNIVLLHPRYYNYIFEEMLELLKNKINANAITNLRNFKERNIIEMEKLRSKHDTIGFQDVGVVFHVSPTAVDVDNILKIDVQLYNPMYMVVFK